MRRLGDLLMVLVVEVLPMLSLVGGGEDCLGLCDGFGKCVALSELYL